VAPDSDLFALASYTRADTASGSNLKALADLSHSRLLWPWWKKYLSSTVPFC